MSQPPAYSRLFSFTGFSASSPNAQQPGVSLDAEFNAILNTVSVVRTNLALIQRDDGAIANGSVGINQLDSTGLALIGANGFNVRGPWIALRTYHAADVFSIANALYLVVVDHVSNPSAAVDVAAGRVIGPILSSGGAALPGNAVLNGAIDPASGVGQDGDFYINTASLKIFGPKAAGAWPAGTAMVGAQGSAGTNGTNGANGANGSTVQNGAGAPGAGLGNDGDYYIDNTAHALYGPKTAGAWGSSTSLVGPSGAGTGDMLKTDNLSGLANNVTARTNLGAASTATFTSGAAGLTPASGGGTVNFQRADGAWAVPGSSGVSYAHFQEQQPSGSNSTATLTGSAWSTLVLNATLTNGVGGSLSSNQVTLPAGSYEIQADAVIGPGAGSGNIKMRLRNVTDATTPVVGPSMGGGKIDGMAMRGYFTIAGTKVFALQCWTQNAGATGQAVTSGEVEVYASLYIRKVA